MENDKEEELHITLCNVEKDEFEDALTWLVFFLFRGIKFGVSTLLLLLFLMKLLLLFGMDAKNDQKLQFTFLLQDIYYKTFILQKYESSQIFIKQQNQHILEWFLKDHVTLK